MMSANLASSEGCSRHEPTPSHRDDPLTLMPSPGTITAASRTRLPNTDTTPRWRHRR